MPTTPHTTVTLAIPPGAQRAFLAGDLAADGLDANTADPADGPRHVTAGLVVLDTDPPHRPRLPEDDDVRPRG